MSFTVFRTLLMVALWSKVCSFPLESLSFTTPSSSTPSLTVTASTFTAMPPAPTPTPTTVLLISRWVWVLTVSVSSAFTVLLSTVVVTVSLNVLTSTPTPIPPSKAPAPVPVASFTFKAFVVSTVTVSAVSSLPAIRLVTRVSTLFTATLLAMAPLNKPAATPTEVSVASNFVLLDAPMDSFGLPAAPVCFLMLLFSTSAVTEELSFTTPTPTFREPAPLAEMASPASTFRL